VRDSMAQLVTRLRSLIGDTAGAAEHFTDDRLEELLDGHRIDVRELELAALDSYEGAGGSARVHWRELLAPYKDWEDGVVVRDYRYELLTPATTDLRNGRWTFEPELYSPALYVTGQTYDLAGAGADALEEWASHEARSFDVQTQGAQLARSQKSEALRAQALELRRRQRISVGRLVRTDEANTC
jgi:hypothetical protein